MRLRFFCCFMRGQKQGETSKKPQSRHAIGAKIRKNKKKALMQAIREGKNKEKAKKAQL